MKRLLLIPPLLLVGIPAAVWALHPWPVLLRWAEPRTTAYIEHRLRGAAAAGEELEIRREWVPLEELPSDLIRAVLVAEDDRFRDHGGVDWNALAEEVRYRGTIPPRLQDPQDRAALREAWRTLRENRDAIRGRSTLTQQLARNLYLSPDRSMVRKAQEFLVARRLEFFLSKDRILELYLNTVELGPGIFGVEAASQSYFQRSARELNRHQAASLAGTLPHPLTSNPATSPARMAWRRDRILARLAGGTAPVPPPEVPEPTLRELEPLELEAPPVPNPTDPTADPEPRTDPDSAPDLHPDTVPDPAAPPDTSGHDSLPPSPGSPDPVSPASAPPGAIGSGEGGAAR